MNTHERKIEIVKRDDMKARKLDDEIRRGEIQLLLALVRKHPKLALSEIRNVLPNALKIVDNA